MIMLPWSTLIWTSKLKRSSPTRWVWRFSAIRSPTICWWGLTVCWATTGVWCTPRLRWSSWTNCRICCRCPCAQAPSTEGRMWLELDWWWTTGRPSADCSRRPLRSRWWRASSSYRIITRWRKRADFINSCNKSATDLHYNFNSYIYAYLYLFTPEWIFKAFIFSCFRSSCSSLSPTPTALGNPTLASLATFPPTPTPSRSTPEIPSGDSSPGQALKTSISICIGVEWICWAVALI